MRKTNNKQINIPSSWDHIYNTEKDKIMRINTGRREWLFPFLSESFHILDVGCGWGELFLFLKGKRDFTGVGIDICPKTIEENRSRVPEFKWILTSVENMEFKKEFDYVFCGEVLEHLNCPLKAVANIITACKVGGLIFITVPKGTHDWYHMWEIQPRDLFLLSDKLEVINYSVVDQTQQCIAYRRVK